MQGLVSKAADPYSRVYMAAEYITGGRHGTFLKVMHKHKIAYSVFTVVYRDTGSLVPIGLQYIMVAFYEPDSQL